MNIDPRMLGLRVAGGRYIRAEVWFLISPALGKEKIRQLLEASKFTVGIFGSRVSSVLGTPQCSTGPNSSSLSRKNVDRRVADVHGLLGLNFDLFQSQDDSFRVRLAASDLVRCDAGLEESAQVDRIERGLHHDLLHSRHESQVSA